MLDVYRNEELTCKSYGTLTTRNNLACHKNGCSAGTLINNLFVPTSQQSSELKTLITLPRNVLLQLPELFFNATYVMKVFTAFI